MHPNPGSKNLVVCLDGTWNNLDSSTNILHIFHAARSNDGDPDCGQQKYYNTGVGTGLLDGISGGAFGIGLEAKVRDAYHWLVRVYNPGDRIFIFGFSRGAYTARSLAGFIFHCGLLRRGAILTVSQLWEAYRENGRLAEGSQSWWERLAGHQQPEFRSIGELADELGPNPSPETISANLTEKEKIVWAATHDDVAIHFLGIFDTVGAMGIDALAVPGLRSRLGLVHNTNLNPDVQHCRHALALDEHRDSFVHTPVNIREPWPFKAAQGDVEQRWFSGSHSNVGGGYEWNSPALAPLRWMLQEAWAKGMKLKGPPDFDPAKPDVPLEFDKILPTEVATPPRSGLRDSYAEFAAPVWEHIIRAKRRYRRVSPPAERKGQLMKDGGEKIHSAPESVDKSVWDLALPPQDTGKLPVASYTPPNLLEAVSRLELPQDIKTAIEKRSLASSHYWSASGWKGMTLLILWSVVATLGLRAAGMCFFPGSNLGQTWWWLGALCGALLVVIDWAESKLNHSLALKPDFRPWSEVLLDCLYWLRAGGLALFCFGAFSIGLAVLQLLYGLPPTWPGQPFLLSSIVGAAVPMTLLARWRSPAPPSSERKSQFSVPGIPLIVLFALGLFITVTKPGAETFRRITLGMHERYDTPPEVIDHAGSLLLVLVASIYFINSFFHWVGERTKEARLGSIVALQTASEPKRITAIFRAWTLRLFPEDTTANASDESRKQEMRYARRDLEHIIKVSLARDWLGLIPVYIAFLVSGLWFATQHLGWAPLPQFLRGIHWGWFPVAVAVADCLENSFHWHYAGRLRSDSDTWYPSWFAHGLCMTFIALKFIGLGFLILIWVGPAIVLGGVNLLYDWQGAGWRGGIAAVLVLMLLIRIGMWIVAIINGSLKPETYSTGSIRSEGWISEWKDNSKLRLKQLKELNSELSSRAVEKSKTD